MSHRAAVTSLVLSAALLFALTGCAGPDWYGPRADPLSIGSPGSGFVPPETPAPEATVRPTPGSWHGVSPAPGYRVVLLTHGDDAPTVTLSAAVEDWAAAHDVQVRTVRADDQPVAAIVRAMDLDPDLIVSVGNGLIDALALITPNHLDRHFLVLGAELAEPTANVTAVEWTGAGFRGEGLGASSHFDEASFTPQRCDDAIRAGSAAVLAGMTGVVLWID